MMMTSFLNYRGIFLFYQSLQILQSFFALLNIPASVCVEIVILAVFSLLFLFLNEIKRGWRIIQLCFRFEDDLWGSKRLVIEFNTFLFLDFRFKVALSFIPSCEGFVLKIISCWFVIYFVSLSFAFYCYVFEIWVCSRLDFGLFLSFELFFDLLENTIFELWYLLYLLFWLLLLLLFMLLLYLLYLLFILQRIRWWNKFICLKTCVFYVDFVH